MFYYTAIYEDLPEAKELLDELDWEDYDKAFEEELKDLEKILNKR